MTRRCVFTDKTEALISRRAQRIRNSIQSFRTNDAHRRGRCHRTTSVADTAGLATATATTTATTTTLFHAPLRQPVHDRCIPSRLDLTRNRQSRNRFEPSRQLGTGLAGLYIHTHEPEFIRPRSLAQLLQKHLRVRTPGRIKADMRRFAHC